MSEVYDAIVIGAGAAGLFCAANLKGLKVLVLEKKLLPGRKLLLSGNGQCNITHAGDIRDFAKHYGNNGSFLRPALMSFSNKDTIDFFERRGIKFKETEQGKFFPKSMSADDVLDALLDICDEQGADIFYEETVKEINRKDELFEVVSVSTKYYSKTVVLACGGMSYPGTGSEGDGYLLAQRLGHNIVEPNPSLSPVYINEFPMKELAGISIPDAEISVWRAGRKVLSHKDDLLITGFGFSGPAILNSSRYIRAGDVLRINFAGVARADADKSIVEMCSVEGGRLVRNILRNFGIPERLAKLIAEMSKADEVVGSQMTSKMRSEIVKNLCEYDSVVERVGDFYVAMCTAGGVALDEVNKKTMESKILSGLFFAGEVLDVDGDTGGYNLQAAFSTAVLASRRVRELCA